MLPVVAFRLPITIQPDDNHSDVGFLGERSSLFDGFRGVQSLCATKSDTGTEMDEAFGFIAVCGSSDVLE